MYKIVPSDRLTGLLDMTERLVAALDEAPTGCDGVACPCSYCALIAEARWLLEAWGDIEERSNQAEDDIQHLAITAKALMDVVDRLESALDITIPEASRLHEAIGLVTEAFPAEREGQYEEERG